MLRNNPSEEKMPWVGGNTLPWDFTAVKSYIVIRFRFPPERLVKGLLKLLGLVQPQICSVSPKLFREIGSRTIGGVDIPLSLDDCHWRCDF